MHEGDDQDVVKWWDVVGTAVRAARSEAVLIIGRQAERLSLEYELKRTGVAPVWQSLESNFSGYDVLSIESSSSKRKLKIEVKGTTQSVKEASFFLTRNEWDTAQTSELYAIDLWLVKASPFPKCFRVFPTDLEAFVPSDKQSGKWQQALIPFREFRKNELAI